MHVFKKFKISTPSNLIFLLIWPKRIIRTVKRIKRTRTTIKMPKNHLLCTIESILILSFVMLLRTSIWTSLENDDNSYGEKGKFGLFPDQQWHFPVYSVYCIHSSIELPSVGNRNNARSILSNAQVDRLREIKMVIWRITPTTWWAEICGCDSNGSRQAVLSSIHTP